MGGTVAGTALFRRFVGRAGSLLKRRASRFLHLFMGAGRLRSPGRVASANRTVRLRDPGWCVRRVFEGVCSVGPNHLVEDDKAVGLFSPPSNGSRHTVKQG